MDELFTYWKRLRSGRETALALLVHEIPLAKYGFHDYLGNVPELIALAIGPEGGFSPAKAEAFIDAGFNPVRLRRYGFEGGKRRVVLNSYIANPDF